MERHEEGLEKKHNITNNEFEKRLANQHLRIKQIKEAAILGTVSRNFEERLGMELGPSTIAPKDSFEYNLQRSIDVSNARRLITNFKARDNQTLALRSMSVNKTMKTREREMDSFEATARKTGENLKSLRMNIENELNRKKIEEDANVDDGVDSKIN